MAQGIGQAINLEVPMCSGSASVPEVLFLEEEAQHGQHFEIESEYDADWTAAAPKILAGEGSTQVRDVVLEGETPFKAGQVEVLIQVSEGESAITEDNNILGKLPPAEDAGSGGGCSSSQQQQRQRRRRRGEWPQDQEQVQQLQ